MSSLHELARQHADLYDGHDLVAFREAGFPVFRAQLQILTLHHGKIPAVNEFILRSIKAGLTTADEIAAFLGLPLEDVRPGAAELLQAELIRAVPSGQGPRILQLTAKGEGALLGSMLPTREQTDLSLVVDGLTGALQPHTSRFLKAKELKKQAIWAMPRDLNMPDETYFSFERVRDFFLRLAAEHRMQLRGELLDVTEVEKVWLEYRPMNLLVYRSREIEEYQFAVFFGNRRAPEYEPILQRMERKGLPVIPVEDRSSVPDLPAEEVKPLLPDPVRLELPVANPGRSASVTKEIEGLTSRIAEVQAQLQATQSREERARLEAEVNALSEQVAERTAEADALRKSVQVLGTYEHRPLLEEAFDRAQERVIIVSPWIKRDAVDEDLITRISRAMDRKVMVVLGYGIAPDTVVDRKQHDQFILRKLQQLKGGRSGQYLRLVELGNTHEKVLICDTTFAVVSSFNFLSFRGSRERGFREERGLYVGMQHVVESLAADVLGRIAEAEERQNRA